MKEKDVWWKVFEEKIGILSDEDLSKILRIFKWRRYKNCL
jgi:hypothetical protein